MRKPLPIFIIVIILVIGGYYVFWQQQAATIEKRIVSSIDNTNKGLAPLLGSIQAISYEKLSVEGSPTSVRLVLTKPVINIPVSDLFAIWVRNRNPGLEPVASPFRWIERISMPDGQMIITSNIAGSSITVELAKSQILTTVVDDREDNPRTVVYEQAPVCSVGSAKGFIVHTPKSMQEFMQEFRSLACNFTKVQMSDPEGKVMLTSDAADFSINTDIPAENRRVLDITSSVTNSKSTADMDDQNIRYYNLITQMRGREPIPYFNIPESAYGTTNFAVDLHYEGPANQQGIGATIPDFTLHLKHLDIQNDLYHFSMTLNAQSQKSDIGGRDAFVTLKSVSKFAPLFDELKLKQLQSYASFAINQEGMIPLPFSETLRSWKAEDIHAAISDIYPRMSALGDIDAEVNATLNTGADLQSGTLKITSFGIRTSPYGLALGSSVNVTNNKPTDADLVVMCLSCDTLLQTFGNYAIAVNKYAVKIMPDTQEYFTAPLISALRSYLYTLAVTADVRPEGLTNKDWVYHLQYSDSGKATLNRKPAMVAFNDLMAQIGPYIPMPTEVRGSQKSEEKPAKKKTKRKSDS